MCLEYVDLVHKKTHVLCPEWEREEWHFDRLRFLEATVEKLKKPCGRHLSWGRRRERALNFALDRKLDVIFIDHLTLASMLRKSLRIFQNLVDIPYEHVMSPEMVPGRTVAEFQQLRDDAKVILHNIHVS